MPPHRRNVNTVFQSYALFPHLDVAANVAFGLKYKRLGKEEQRRKVAEVLELVQLQAAASDASRRSSPAASSNASRSPVPSCSRRACCCSTSRSARSTRACGRDLQVELKAIQADVGVTFVFVTHDQEEALTMSDRVAVMNNGRVEQAASPREVYEEPTHELRRRLPRRFQPARRRGEPRRRRLQPPDRRAVVPGPAGRDRVPRLGQGDDQARADRRRSARNRRRQPASRARRALGLPRRRARGPRARAGRRAPARNDPERRTVVTRRRSRRGRR